MHKSVILMRNTSIMHNMHSTYSSSTMHRVALLRVVCIVLY